MKPLRFQHFTTESLEPFSILGCDRFIDSGLTCSSFAWLINQVIFGATHSSCPLALDKSCAASPNVEGLVPNWPQTETWNPYEGTKTVKKRIDTTL